MKYRVDRNPFHSARWINPYAASDEIAVEEKDWEAIKAEANAASELVVGFQESDDVLKFDMHGFRDAIDKVERDCRVRGSR